MKKEKQVRWRDMAWIWRHLCVCPLIDHGQQPTKMHTEVTLDYKSVYICVYFPAWRQNALYGCEIDNLPVSLFLLTSPAQGPLVVIDSIKATKFDEV